MIEPAPKQGYGPCVADSAPSGPLTRHREAGPRSPQPGSCQRGSDPSPARSPGSRSSPTQAFLGNPSTGSGPWPRVERVHSLSPRGDLFLGTKSSDGRLHPAGTSRVHREGEELAPALWKPLEQIPRAESKGDLHGGGLGSTALLLPHPGAASPVHRCPGAHPEWVGRQKHPSVQRRAPSGSPRHGLEPTLSTTHRPLSCWRAGACCFGMGVAVGWQLRGGQEGQLPLCLPFCPESFKLDTVERDVVSLPPRAVIPPCWVLLPWLCGPPTWWDPRHTAGRVPTMKPHLEPAQGLAT